MVHLRPGDLPKAARSRIHANDRRGRIASLSSTPGKSASRHQQPYSEATAEKEASEERRAGSEELTESAQRLGVYFAGFFCRPRPGEVARAPPASFGCLFREIGLPQNKP